MPKRHSPLDEPLARRASEIAGVEVTRTQVEDWREASIFEVAKEGDRPGSYDYWYVPGSHELAACLASVLAKGRAEGRVPTVDEAVLVCFVRGHRPRERGLRRAYDRSYQALGVGPEEPMVTRRDAGKIARRASRHPLTRALKQHVERPSDLYSVLSNLIAVASGASSLIKPQTAMVISGAFGASQEFAEHMNPPGPSLVDYAKAVRTASFEELVTARDLACILVATGQRIMGLMADELGFEIKVPEGLPDIWNELITAVAWVPHVLIKRREKGAETYDAVMRSLPQLLAQEFPEGEATDK